MAEKLAIVGSGISGLGAAYALRKDFSVTLFEQDRRPGGHTNTVTVADQRGQHSIDTGFIVYNTSTYPLLTRLFDELGVSTQWSDMSFSYRNLETNLEWAGNNLNGVFGQRSNLFRPRFWTLLADIMRFKTQALHELASNAERTLGEFLENSAFREPFIRYYILPMGAAIWSIPERDMRDFPARAFLQFFKNHGLLGTGDHLRWRTVTGGSQTYIQAILQAVQPALRLGEPVQSVVRKAQGAEVITAAGSESFDRVLIATHADQALKILAQPTDEERRILSCFRYQKNRAVLHTDRSVMPVRRRCWASWNYRYSSDGETSVGYYMNPLQGLQTDTDYILSLNEFAPIDPDRIQYEVEYEHPLFDRKALRMQPELAKLNDAGPVYFSGSYFRHGFHEDGLASAIDAARRISNAVPAFSAV